MQIAEQLEEYEAGYHGGGWVAGMPSVHAYAPPIQHERQHQALELQQQHQQQWHSHAQAPASLPANRGGRQGSNSGAPAACLTGTGDHDAYPAMHHPAPSPVPAHRPPTVRHTTAQQPEPECVHQQHQGQQQQAA
eukprot:scaffold175845_cov19-Tisochrysis_lutea.AAC.1